MRFSKKKKNFRFPVMKLITNIFCEKRLWNFKHCQDIYLIGTIVINHTKKTSYPSLSRWNYVKIFVSWTTANIKKSNALAWAFKKLIFCGSIWGVCGEVVIQIMSKHLSLKWLRHEKTGTLGSVVQKKWFLGSPQGLVPPNYVKIFVS